MKKYWLLLSFLCLFLAACSFSQEISTEETEMPNTSGEMPDTPVAESSSENINPQVISSLISFDTWPYNASGYDKEGYNKSGYNEYGYDRWMYDKEEGYKRWGYMGFLENPRYDYEGWGLPPHREQHYLLQRTGDSTLADRANGRPVYTNDPYREVQPLELKKTDKDASSYYCFYCEPDREAVEYDGEDKNNLFINYQLAVPKSSLSAYVPLQQIWIQAVDGLIGYVDGYLLQFPFKFPVDNETFSTVQRKGQLQYWKSENIFSLEELAWEFRRPRFQNAGEVIDRYLWDDKDWVYYRTPGNVISIDRVKKNSDFKMLSGV